MVLENEFDRSPSEWRFGAPFLEYILMQDGEPRCGIRSGQGHPVNSSPPTNFTEITLQDLQSETLLPVILGARAICMASLKTPDFAGLLEFILIKIRPGQGIFLDTRRGADNLPKLPDILKTPLQRS
jgi:hypothetical protein